MKVRYLFSRLNISLPEGKHKYDFIYDSLTSKTTANFGEYKYSFLNIQRITLGNDEFIAGDLARILDSKIEVADLAKRTGETTAVKNAIDSKSRFFIHMGTNIMALNTIGFPYDTFQNKFAELFVNANPEIEFDIHIDPINERYNFLETLKSFTTVKHIRIDLRPSNPHSDPIWDDIDKRLHKLRATSYTEIIENKTDDDSLNINEEELEEKIQMALDGYGTAEGSGTIDGKKETIRTDKTPVKDYGRDNQNAFYDILDDLYQTFRRLISRIDS